MALGHSSYHLVDKWHLRCRSGHIHHHSQTSQSWTQWSPLGEWCHPPMKSSSYSVPLKTQAQTCAEDQCITLYVSPGIIFSTCLLTQNLEPVSSLKPLYSHPSIFLLVLESIKMNTLIAMRNDSAQHHLIMQTFCWNPCKLSFNGLESSIWELNLETCCPLSYWLAIWCTARHVPFRFFFTILLFVQML